MMLVGVGGVWVWLLVVFFLTRRRHPKFSKRELVGGVGGVNCIVIKLPPKRAKHTRSSAASPPP